MSVLLNITFKEEISDHDGYCSDSECELTTRIYKKVVNVNVNEITNNLQYFIKYADKAYVSEGNSGYCGFTDEVVKAGLDIHDVRITTIKVKIVNIKEDKSN